MFSGDLTENMKVESHGTYGHIGFGVNDCEAAIRYFVNRGMTLREETKRFDEQGRCIFAYFKEEVRRICDPPGTGLIASGDIKTKRIAI